MNVSDYLDRKHFQYRRRGENAVFNCPFCGEKERKFAISLATGAFNCLHLNSCGVKGSFYEFQKMLGDTPEREKKRDRFISGERKKSYSKPKPKLETLSNTVIDYLKSRGFSPKTIEYFKIGSQNSETAAIPYYKNGELVNVKYRSIVDKKNMHTEKNAEPTLFNRDNIELNILTICEGEYDTMALYEYGIESVSVPMGAGNHQWIETEWEYLETFHEIYLCFDNDAAGNSNAREVAQKLGEWKCKLVTLPKKDANECLKSGVTIKQVSEAFANAEELQPETLTSPSFYSEKIRRLFYDGTVMGTKTPWEGLNKILKGWRDGEVTIWSGRNGSGKSTILNQVFLDLAGKNIKSCIYSGEMPPERYLRWAIIQHGKKERPMPMEIDNILSWMEGKIFILNITQGIEPDKLLSDFEYAARRYGVKHFFIDSLMKIRMKGHDEYRDQQEFMDKITSFAMRHGSHVHLVAHPRKSDSDDDAPGKVDVKGTGHLTDMAHNVMVLYRLSNDKKEYVKRKGQPADMCLYIKKNREFGIEGKVNMMFNEETKCFSDQAK